MTGALTILGAGALGMTAAWLLVPLTRRELAAAAGRAGAAPVTAAAGTDRAAGERQANLAAVADPLEPHGATDEVELTSGQRWALVVVSGLIPAYVLGRVGWAAVALPPLLLLLGLVQLAYCDLTRRLLPKTLVYLLTAAVVASGVLVAGFGH